MGRFASIPILGLPLFVWIGGFAMVLFLAVATIGLSQSSTKFRLPFVWHKPLALTAITLALIHGVLALSFLFGW